VTVAFTPVNEPVAAIAAAATAPTAAVFFKADIAGEGRRPTSRDDEAV